MQASFDPGISKAGSLAAVVWKDREPVEWRTFKPRVTEPLLSRCEDLTDQLLDWLDDCQHDHRALITEIALESFIDFQPRKKNKSLAQLNVFRGYLAKALLEFNNRPEYCGNQPEIMDVCKGNERKNVADHIARNLYGINSNQHVRDACYIGHLAGFGK